MNVSNPALTPEIVRACDLLFVYNNPQAAAQACKLILKQRADDPYALHVLGLSLCHEGTDMAEGVALIERSVSLAPNVSLFRQNLGAVWGRLGRYDRAATELSQAVALCPRAADAHAGLAAALEQLGNLQGAEAVASRAVELAPRLAAGHNALGSVLERRGEHSAAIKEFSLAIQLWPEFSEAWTNLARTYEAMGEGPDAFRCYREAVRFRPADPTPHSNLLFAMHNDPGCTPATIYAEHQEWARRHAPPYDPSSHPHANPPEPERRLRVGYVSPDFRFHIVGRLLLPLLRHHDRDHFEVYCYSDNRKPDTYTALIRGVAEVWRETANLSHAALAELIWKDRIDILMDPNGHIAGNRLLVFARKPAPVQVTHFGYPNTTGLATMDYRFTDALSEPPGATERYNSERLYRIEDCWWCYLPEDPGPAPTPLPAVSTGHVTFGCLNKLIKVSAPCVQLWSKILRTVPGSRLILLADGDPDSRKLILNRFARCGADPAQLEVATKRPHDEYMKLHDRIDIVLDTFPFNGDNTTCDAMWCGVPVVTLAGNSFVSRRGVSHLSTIGLAELIANTTDEYVAKAVELAGDLPRLAQLRSSLRDRMLRSPLCDATAFARKIERAYRQMWRRWCNPGSSDP